MTFINVVFKVQLNELLHKNNKIFVCGSIPKIRDWYPMKATVLTRQEFSKIDKFEIWSVEMLIPLTDISYSDGIPRKKSPIDVYGFIGGFKFYADLLNAIDHENRKT